MIVSVSVTNLKVNTTSTVYCPQAEECPICHAHIVSKILSGACYGKGDDMHATVLHFCSGCSSCFITTHLLEKNSKSSSSSLFYNCKSLIASEPVRYVADVFSNNLASVSPMFIDIYNQSKQAETLNMQHIAGIGYRKALEFLVKDYSIRFHSDKSDSIKTMPLAQCINTYIDHPKIKTLAERSVWLGNDETHYVRKHADKDVEDLKRFISACVNYIDMELTLEEAEAMPRA